MILLLLAGCLVQPGDDFFFLERDGAIMPVWVTGPPNADTQVVLLHGGPGGSGGLYAHADGLNRLEEAVQVVYWDQRGSVASQGNPSEDTLTVDAMVADLALLTDVLEARDPAQDRVLLGHSFGGTLGVAALREPAIHDAYTAYLHVDGGHDLTCEAYQQSEDFVFERLRGYLQTRANDADTWNDGLAFYRRTDCWSRTNVAEHSVWVARTNGYDPDGVGSPSGGQIAELAFLSPYDMQAVLKNNGRMVATVDAWPSDLRPGMADITLPTLVMWGDEDGILPVGLAPGAVDALGTPADDVALSVFEGAGHSPFHDDGPRFAREVLDFVDDHR